MLTRSVKNKSWQWPLEIPEVVSIMSVEFYDKKKSTNIVGDLGQE